MLRKIARVPRPGFDSKSPAKSDDGGSSIVGPDKKKDNSPSNTILAEDDEARPNVSRRVSLASAFETALQGASNIRR